MNPPFHKRRFRSFVSTAYAGGTVVEQLEHWLADTAGIPLLHDAHSDVAGAPNGSGLDSALAMCQSLVILLTRRAVESGWARMEFDAGMRRQGMDGPAFRILPIRIDDCELPEFLQDARWIDISEEGLTVESAATILLSLYSVGAGALEGKSRDVYFIRSGRDDENRLENLLSAAAKRLGFRLIAHPEDGHVDGNNIETILSGCGGGIAVIRGGISGKPLQRMIEDMERLAGLGLPYLVFASGTVNLPDTLIRRSVGHLSIPETMDNFEVEFSNRVRSLLLQLQEEWVPPSRPPYIFYGTDLKEEHKHRNRLVQRVIQQVASMPCMVGEDIRQGQVQREIIDRVIHAQMMLADISKENLNTCIEAGVAIGAHVPVHLVSGDERHKPPFMFRDRQIWHYQNDLDLLGIVHKLVLPHRRLIV